MTLYGPLSDSISPNLATNPAELPSVPRKRVPSNPLAAVAAVAAAPAASSSCFPDRQIPQGALPCRPHRVANTKSSCHPTSCPATVLVHSKTWMLRSGVLISPVVTLTIVLVATFVRQPNGNGLHRCHSTSTWRCKGLMMVGMLLFRPTRLFKWREFACPLGLKHGVIVGFNVATFKTSIIRATWSFCALRMRGYTKPGWRRYFAVLPNGVGRRKALSKHLTLSCCATVGGRSMASIGLRTAGYSVRMPVQNRASAIVAPSSVQLALSNHVHLECHWVILQGPL